MSFGHQGTALRRAAAERTSIKMSSGIPGMSFKPPRRPRTLRRATCWTGSGARSFRVSVFLAFLRGGMVVVVGDDVRRGRPEVR